jgi:hypothetical protein
MQKACASRLGPSGLFAPRHRVDSRVRTRLLTGDFGPHFWRSRRVSFCRGYFHSGFGSESSFVCQTLACSGLPQAS